MVRSGTPAASHAAAFISSIIAAELVVVPLLSDSMLVVVVLVSPSALCVRFLAMSLTDAAHASDTLTKAVATIDNGTAKDPAISDLLGVGGDVCGCPGRGCERGS